jgi:MerR family redox-sensitive transcriptional activator SoxR
MDRNGRLLTIGEVARQAGLRTSAIRFYESVGLLPPPERRVGGQRRYEPAVLDWLVRIQVAQRAGLTIEEIRELFAGLAHGATLSTEWRALAERKLPEVRALIRRAQEVESWLEDGLRCDCLDLMQCTVTDHELAGVPVTTPRRESPRRSGWQRKKRSGRAGW